MELFLTIFSIVTLVCSFVKIFRNLVAAGRLAATVGDVAAQAYAKQNPLGNYLFAMILAICWLISRLF